MTTELLLTIGSLLLCALVMWGIFKMAKHSKTKRKTPVTDESNPKE